MGNDYYWEKDNRNKNINLWAGGQWGKPAYRVCEGCPSYGLRPDKCMMCARLPRAKQQAAGTEEPDPVAGNMNAPE